MLNLEEMDEDHLERLREIYERLANKTGSEGSGQAKPESNVGTRRNLSNYLYDVVRLLIPCYLKAAQFFCSPSARESGETLKPVVPQLPALVSIQITSPMIPITRIAPTQTPALKISPAISQPARLTIEITRVMDKIEKCLMVSSSVFHSKAEQPRISTTLE